MLDVGWWGSLRDLSKNILKQGYIKAKLFVGGGDFEGVITLVPLENFNHTDSPNWGYFPNSLIKTLIYV